MWIWRLPLPAAAGALELHMGTERRSILFENSVVRSEALYSVESIGTGPDVLFIPGHGSSKAVWAAVAQALCSSHRVHLIQVAGMAGAPPPRAPGEDAVGALVRAIGHELLPLLSDNTSVIGHSMGCAVGLAMAQRWPDRVHRLMLVDAFPFVGIPIAGLHSTLTDLQPMREALAAGGTPATMAMLAGSAPMWVRSPVAQEKLLRWAESSDPATLHAYLLSLLAVALRPGLRTLGIPVTLVYGDHAALGATGEALAALFEAAYADVPNLRRQCIADSQHFVMEDQPEVFAASVRHFLR